MAEITKLAERAWEGDLGGVNVHPARSLVDFEEIETGLGFMSAFSNALVLETGDGLTFVDTSSVFHAEKLFENVRAWSSSRVNTGIYTHGHVDHVFGLQRFYTEVEEKGWPNIRIIAHEACPARFDRYALTAGYNGFVNARQFNFPRPLFPKKFRYPDETVADSGASTEAGTTEIRPTSSRRPNGAWLVLWQSWWVARTGFPTRPSSMQETGTSPWPASWSNSRGGLTPRPAGSRGREAKFTGPGPRPRAVSWPRESSTRRPVIRVQTNDLVEFARNRPKFKDGKGASG